MNNIQSLQETIVPEVMPNTPAINSDLPQVDSTLRDILSLPQEILGKIESIRIDIAINIIPKTSK